MFAIIEKQGERKAVYSQRDLEYMIGRGWEEVRAKEATLPPEIIKPEPKKRGRPRKGE